MQHSSFIFNESGKHCGSRSDSFVRSHLIMIYSFQKRINLNSAGQGLKGKFITFLCIGIVCSVISCAGSNYFRFLRFNKLC